MSMMYRFPSGIRVLMSAVKHGVVQVAQPDIQVGVVDKVRLNDDGTIFTFPGTSFLEFATATHEITVKHEGQWSPFTKTLIRVPVKKKRKPRKRNKK